MNLTLTLEPLLGHDPICELMLTRTDGDAVEAALRKGRRQVEQSTTHPTSHVQNSGGRVGANALDLCRNESVHIARRFARVSNPWSPKLPVDGQRTTTTTNEEEASRVAVVVTRDAWGLRGPYLPDRSFWSMSPSQWPALSTLARTYGRL